MTLPENDDTNPIYIVYELDAVAISIRKEAVKTVQYRYDLHMDAGLTKSGKPRRMNKDHYEDIFPIKKVIDILTETLPYIEQHKKYGMNEKYFYACVDKTTKEMFVHICNQLVDAGVLELIFDTEVNDFAYRTVRDKKK